MKTFSQISSLVVLLLLSWPLDSVHAHSARARPLKRLVNPSTLALEILPRQPQQLSPSTPLSKRLAPPANTLRHDDTFRLTISAFDETYYLHLRPNDHLIHPAARINYYSTTPDGHSYVTHTTPLLRESVKAYWGEVIAVSHTEARMREDAAGVVHYSSHPAELGWVRIMVHHQGDMERGIAPEYEGAFTVNGVVHHIMTKDNYYRTKDELDPAVSEPLDYVDSSLVIWRESDVMTAEEERIAKRETSVPGKSAAAQSCGHDRLAFNTDPLQNPLLARKPLISESWYDKTFNIFQNETIQRRDDMSLGGGDMGGNNFIDNIGSSDGCPISQKVLFMGVAADCNYVSIYGSQDNATKQILTTWNSASSLYKKTFNVSLGIVELQVQGVSCPSTPDPSHPWNVPCSSAELDPRLSLFSQWRGDKGEDKAGLWHLMSGCPTGSEVGIAWLGTLCQSSASGAAPTVVSGTAVSTAGRTEWQVVAHEIGHNFGAIHDCADGCTSSSPCCPLSGTGDCNANAKFIMSPVAQLGEKTFSPCSLGNICSVMKIGGRTDTTCLLEPGSEKVISLKMCGNGIVEDGEDCDPGNNVESSCCDSATCKFKNNAVCDPESSLCCTDQCSFAPTTKTCRPPKDPLCDTAEFCTGNSSSCPADVVTPNGQSCGNGDLKCASGLCTSIGLQCQTIGASMGLKEACPNKNDNTCQVSCQDPKQSNQCIVLTSLLIDGSSCGYGGTCHSGKCQAGSFLDTAKSWYTQNLQISIPVSIVAGLLALLILWGIAKCIARCCGYGGKHSRSMDSALPKAQHQRIESYDRHQGYTTAPPTFLPPSLQPANPSYSRVPLEQQYEHGGGDGRYPNSNMNWVDESAYNGRR